MSKLRRGTARALPTREAGAPGGASAGGVSDTPQLAPAVILLVEDNPGDAELVEECLETVGVPLSLHVARDGEEALRFARGQGEHAAAVRPTLILLDLNIPKKDGRAVLRELKSDPKLRDIPVIVMTSSEAPRDIAAAYALQANCYVTKASSYAGTLALMRTLGEFWLKTARLPSTGR